MIDWEALSPEQVQYVLDHVTYPLAVMLDFGDARQRAERTLGDPSGWKVPTAVPSTQEGR